jgi:hypothetical protein
MAAELACQLDVETKLLFAGRGPPNAPSRSAIKPSTETLIQ